MRIGILPNALKLSFFPTIFLLAGCTANGAWDVLRDLREFPGPGTYTETLIATQDTSIHESLPSNNYGSCSNLATNQSGGSDLGQGRVLVQFDLSSISPAAIINSAELKLTKTGGDLGAIDQHIHKLTTSWIEGGGSCIGSPGGSSWNSPWGAGGDYDPGSIGFVGITADIEYSWVSAALTTLVDEWNQGVTPNCGLKVGSPDAGTEFRFFASRENATASDRPKLVINYTIPWNLPFIRFVWTAVDR